MHQTCQLFASASSLEHLNGLLSDYLGNAGIHSFAVTYYHRHTKTGSRLIYDWVSPALKIWHQYYLEQGYADIDRTLEYSEKSLLPVYWSVKDQLENAKNKREQRIREESLTYGIETGLSIPVYGPQGDFIVLVLHQRHAENGLADWQEKQYEWMIIAAIYFQQLRHFLAHEAVKDANLTLREMQCLELTSQGLRLEAIAKLLEVSNRTVNFHLQNANKKLGVNNKYMAIIRWQEQQR
ncbi:LuxR family transcriptional regulator [Legionella birminghamensis]|uniref:LuxR family transcriptional regulator n=1 Tax=Legionella birminghamensis TaxID=28083 RepID=A0A378IGK4_9GAMM|nr:LuxR C-terminal-related transcriptional regulator [Legionella birminghamensis]KTC67967.1 LuxR family transcriptional regulator [Legionella birminghamensis]STX31324.1 LuxR family transcriptional regulator [Legionella birminghamensis]